MKRPYWWTGIETVTEFLRRAVIFSEAGSSVANCQSRAELPAARCLVTNLAVNLQYALDKLRAGARG